MRIFLGGSREASTLTLQVAALIESCGHTPVRWDQPGTFPAGAYTFSALREIAQSVDGAIFIFSEDDHVWYRSDRLTQPRDNVLLEYGLFSQALGEQRVLICRNGNPRTATDLLGIMYINVSEQNFARAEIELDRWLRRIAHPDPNAILMELLRSPFQASGKPSLFRRGTQLVGSAKTRLVLAAKTPIILIGTRPYDGSQPPRVYEQQQYDAYWKAIGDSSTGRGLRFICIASWPCMVDELRKDVSSTLAGRVGVNYKRLLSQSSQHASESRAVFAWHDNPEPMTFMVSDDDFMIWFKDDSGDNVWITANNEVVASALYFQAQAIASRRISDVMKGEIDQQLGLSGDI